MLPGPVDHVKLGKSLTSYVAPGTIPVVLEVYKPTRIVEVAVLDSAVPLEPWTSATKSLMHFRSALDSQGDADLRRELSRLWRGQLVYALMFEVDDSVFEKSGDGTGASSSVAALVGAIAGGVVGVALLLLVFAIYKYRQRRKAATNSPRRSHFASADASAARAVMF